MSSFTQCELQFSHLESINAALMEDGTLIVERTGNAPMEIYISKPAEFVGHWVSTTEVVIADPVTDIFGVSGIKYLKFTDD